MTSPRTEELARALRGLLDALDYGIDLSDSATMERAKVGEMIRVTRPKEAWAELDQAIREARAAFDTEQEEEGARAEEKAAAYEYVLEQIAENTDDLSAEAEARAVLERNKADGDGAHHHNWKRRAEQAESTLASVRQLASQLRDVAERNRVNPTKAATYEEIAGDLLSLLDPSIERPEHGDTGA